MKITAVPAQITTVEDRIAGRLGISQLLLLISPVFIDSALYVCLLPFFRYAVYKVVVMSIVLAFCALLAIRLKGRILLLWLIVLGRFCLRPRYYVFNKQSLHGRDFHETALALIDTAEIKTTPSLSKRPLSLSIAEIIATQSLMENPATKIRFEAKKGGLYVHITEAKQEG